jgi:hypothetical protein
MVGARFWELFAKNPRGHRAITRHGWIGANHGQHLTAFETSANLINDRLASLSRLASLLPGELFREARNGRHKRSHSV